MDAKINSWKPFISIPCPIRDTVCSQPVWRHGEIWCCMGLLPVQPGNICSPCDGTFPRSKGAIGEASGRAQ